MRLFILLLLTTGVAHAQVIITSDPFSAIQPGPITVVLRPFLTIPADGPGATIARITGAVTDGAGRVFINDLSGTIYRTDGSGSAPTLYLDITKQNIGAVANSSFYQIGLSGVAFHPNFAGEAGQPGYGKFYTTSYAANFGSSTLGDNTGPVVAQVREWSTATPLAGTFSWTSRVVLAISGYSDEHSSGAIAFNPAAKLGSADYGNLYIGSGDGAYNDANQKAQVLSAPQGEMLRINPLASGIVPYTVPANNPYVGRAGVLPEIYASGLRFPQSFSFDAQTVQLYINDLGQTAIAEVDMGKAGANYGWSQRAETFATGYAQGAIDIGNEHIYATPAALSAYTDPIAEYWHSEGAALGSGFLYRGTAIPDLFGIYVLADIVVGRLFYLDPAAVAAGALAVLHSLNLTTDGQPIDLYGTYYPRADARLAELSDHELLLLTKAQGQVFQIGAVDAPEPASLTMLGIGALLSIGRRRLAQAG